MPRDAVSPVGCHVLQSDKPNGVAHAQAVGAEAIQIFVGNPRGWAVPKAAPSADAMLAERCREAGLRLFVHAPYLINLASPTPRTREQSIALLRYCMERSGRLGAQGVVMHAGSAVATGRRDHALRLLRELVLPLLDTLSDDSPDLLVEHTAGDGEALASNVEDLGTVLAALDHHPKLGVCLDTCHAYAAGHDVAAPRGVHRTVDALVRAVGPGRLKLVHANDSMDPLGSKRDRHARVGTGLIGIEPFAELFRHPGVPVVIETPGGIDGHIQDIALLKTLRDR
jgi:deoxyribonuclease-4